MANPRDPATPVPERDETDGVVSTVTRRALRHRSSSLPPASDLDDDLLLRYIDGALSATERETLERRLIVDLDAKERLSILVRGLDEAGFSQPVSQPASRAASVSRFVFHVAGNVLELLRGDGATVLQPAMAVRGTTQPNAFAIERVFQTAHGALSARFELHAERGDAPHPGLVDLVVHVGSDGNPADGVRCKLLREGRPVDSREVEASGCTFARLSAARYDLELRKGGVEVGRLLLDLRS